MTRPVRYLFPDGALLYCRSCQDLRPHKTKDTAYVGCSDCGRRIHVAEVVATYSADEYQNPAPILLPWALLPEKEKVKRMRFAQELTPVHGEYKMKAVDWDILDGKVPVEQVT